MITRFKEQFENVESILDDLQDAQYSAVKTSMLKDFGDDYKVEEKEVDELCDFLQNEVLIPWTHNRVNTEPYIDPKLKGDDLGIMFLQSMESETQRGHAGSVPDAVKRASTFAEHLANTLDVNNLKPDLSKQKTKEMEEKINEDPYLSNREPMPNIINVALFSRSHDEYLGIHIDFRNYLFCR